MKERSVHSPYSHNPQLAGCKRIHIIHNKEGLQKQKYIILVEHHPQTGIHIGRCFSSSYMPWASSTTGSNPEDPMLPFKQALSCGISASC